MKCINYAINKKKIFVNNKYPTTHTTTYLCKYLKYFNHNLYEVIQLHTQFIK